MKYFYKRDDINIYSLTPAYSAGKGKIVAGKRIIFLDSFYASERPVANDKKIGSVGHFHPEEHIAYNIEGGRRFRVGDNWYTLKPGDVSVSYPNVTHEGNSDASYKVLNFKDRINGHSVYSYGAWEPGAEEFYSHIEALIEEGKKFSSTDPWFKDISEIPVYTWSKMNEYQESIYSTGKVKMIVGDKIYVYLARYEEDRGMGDGQPGMKPHSHPEEKIMQLTSGNAQFRVGDEWFTPAIGDIIYVPANTEHEAKGIDGKPFEIVGLKNRVFGHNTYNDTWEEGAKELNKKLDELYEESEKFVNIDPWYKD
ncbi:MAG: AraC family ligand binding domain-containing protein [Angelakisella sp.]|nr:AraC family ligand binding domain-containing protein [Angelakisella sp.]